MGALTNKPMAFSSRNWEYHSQLTTDLTDFLSPRIRVDQFNGKVYRILPTIDWISNRIRFLYIGLRNQRLVTPIFSYELKSEINLKNKIIFLKKKVLLSTSYEESFKLLKIKLSLNKRKNINIVYGAVFNSDTTVLNQFENNYSQLNKFSEIKNKFDFNKLISFEGYDSLTLFGVNPRMESPLLNLQIRDFGFNKIFAVGNFSYSYLVKVLTNSSYFYLLNFNGYIQRGLSIFGISTINYSIDFVNKINLIPLYLLNNSINFDQNQKLKKFSSCNDVNLEFLTQNLIKFNQGFNFLFSSHFSSDVSVQLPVSGYLETNYKFLDKDLQTKKSNSLKPNFGINDLFFAFKLYNKSDLKLRKKGNLVRFTTFRRLIKNILINNGIPNYLIRDPLGRANPLFVSLQ